MSYVTVECFVGPHKASPPSCQGCTPPSDNAPRHSLSPRSAAYRVLGASGAIALCRDCALGSIKSLAARFMLYDPRATADLMDFFAAEATKKRRPTRSTPRKKRGKVIDVLPRGSSKGS
jgi:hypothetical protein